MRKRFLWSIAFCLAAALILIPINLQLIDDAIGSAEGARKLSLFNSMFIQIILIFTLSFTIVNTYYTVHHEEGLFFTDRLRADLDIPDKYLENTGGTGGVGGAPGGEGGQGGEGHGEGGKGGKGGRGGHG